MSENGKTNYLSTGTPDAAGVQAAKKALEDAMRPGPLGDLLEAMTGLVAVTAPGPDMDMAHLGVWSQEIWRALMDYPGDVAVRALQEWRKTPRGEWWPREKPLRDLCERMMGARRQLLAAVNMQEHAAKEAPKGRYSNPFGRTEIFVLWATEQYGAAWASSWLKGGINVQFTEDTIFTTSVGADELRSKCGRKAGEIGVSFVVCPRLRKTFRDYVDAQVPATPREKKKRYGQNAHAD